MSRRTIPPAPLWLGYAGVLPFAGLAAALALDAPAPERVLTAFLVYSGLILSFLGGIRWGAAAAESAGAGPYVISVAPSLWAFACLLVPDPALSLWGLLAGFLVTGAVDVARPAAALAAWMPALRLRLTLAVAVCHGVAIAAI